MYEGRVRPHQLGVLTMTLAVAACDAALAPTATTGLTGVVVRGPITPVCRIEVPCDAPFSAEFSVEQDGRRISRFRSDVEGRFTVMLSAGVYRVVPSADTPIFSPESQVKTVEVLTVGLTEVRLQFDTGIR